MLRGVAIAVLAWLAPDTHNAAVEPPAPQPTTTKKEATPPPPTNLHITHQGERGAIQCHLVDVRCTGGSDTRGNERDRRFNKADREVKQTLPAAATTALHTP